MFQGKTLGPKNEPAGSHHRHLVCWKSIIAGVFISVMTFMILTALGAGIFGSAAQSAVENESGGLALMSGAGFWLGLSAAIALFVGSYFSLRVSGFVTAKVGVANGFVVASIFFILLMVEAGGAVGALSKGLGKVVEGVGKGTSNISANPQVQDAINTALGSTPLKSSPQDVAQGLAVRLMQGDNDSAKSYLAYQTGLSEAEVDAKIAKLKTDFENAAKTIGTKAAATLADVGFMLLMTFAVGLVASIVGGVVGAESNIERPLAQVEVKPYGAPARA